MLFFSDWYQHVTAIFFFCGHAHTKGIALGAVLGPFSRVAAGALAGAAGASALLVVLGPEEVEERMNQGLGWCRDAYAASKIAIDEERQRRDAKKK